MAIRWARPGRAVAVATAAAIEELQAGDRLGEVIVVVPPGPTAATLRRLLPRVSGGVAGIRFLTPIDLAVELVDSSISTMRAVTTQLQLAAITSVMSGDECPVVLRGVRDHPATIDALVEIAMALRAAHVTPGALRALAGGPGSVRSALVDVVVGARERLVAVGVRDESATLAALDDVDERALAGLRVVLVVTDAFHPAQVPFLRRLTSQPLCRLVAVVPTGADTSLTDQLSAFGCDTLPEREPAAIPRVVSCPDPDEEVRYTVRQCASLLDSGVPADDVAIVCAAPQYRRAVRDELQRAGIAWTGGAVERLRGSVAGQVLRHLLDGVVDGWDRPNVFRLLSVAPLHPVGELGAPRRVGQWTSLCRRLGLVTVDDWTRATEALADANQSRRRRWSQGDVDAPPTRRELADDDTLRRLLTLVERLRNQSRRVQRATSWEAASKALGALLVDHIGAATWRERAWADAPAWQRNAADHVERICAGLAELDHDGVAVPFTTATMHQIVATLLDTPVRRRGDAAGAVSILDVAGAVCIGATHVFIVGLNEGLLPVSTIDDLLLGRDLPDAAAAVIEGPRVFASRAQRAWHALLHSDASVTATLARTDLRRGGEMYPSPLLAGMPIQKHESHAAGLLDGPLLTASERLARSEGSYAQSPRLARRTNSLRARLDPQPTEFDGMVGPHPALAPVDKQWAITALERQADCGLGYFGQYVLHVSEETDAASIVSIEPADRGVLVHKVFEQLAGEWLHLDKQDRPPWLRGEHLPAMHRRAIEILDDLATDIGVQHRLGHASAWGAERAHILRSISATIDAEAVEGSQPVACEYTFSGVPVADARFRGNIDRIDQMADGGLRVTDFKTGAKSTLRDVLDGGRKLQLPLYARAADHDRAALVDDASADAPAATARYLYVREAKAEARQVPLDPALIAEFESYVSRWLGEIAGGQFAPRPHPTNGRCLMCCVDSLGIEDLAERARLFDPVGAQATAESMETEG
ncbi:MAG TPA: PD-(D/E)XK nuclease family protein [Ilumatobacteraceae bacterium]|nr:PD-(D/E)XK nuclease family protein [Ilumatobacteraceae bacterium]